MKSRAALFLSFTFFCLAAGACFAARPDEARYVGQQVCALCHKDIAATQAKNAMANTWHGAVGRSLRPAFDETITEGPDPALHYEVRRGTDGFVDSITMSDRTNVTLPIRVIMGGQRHGLSFLAHIEQFNGIPLDRPALIETRYAYSPERKALVLSPGFSTEKPSTYPEAFGHALSSTFEVKCLTCHGEPNTLGAGKEGGIHCETCHGPGSSHLQSIAKGNPRQGIINPNRLNNAKKLEICAGCHSGFTPMSDPFPNDLLISTQVIALRNSECFVQSGEALTCTTCHDPHKDTSQDEEASVTACLSCHSANSTHPTAICPVNARDKCVTCHMPSVQQGSFRMVDHWIRVHPEQGIKGGHHDAIQRPRLQPLREFLRVIATDDKSKAETASRRLAQGDSFFDVARDLSSDPTAALGGYVGDMLLSALDPKLAAAASTLKYGENSPIIDMGNRWMILQRMPRDFKWDADRLLQEAAAAKLQGDRKGALEKGRQALITYPNFLRALIFVGVTLVEGGQVQRAEQTLQFAAQLYPEDAATQFNLGLALGGLGDTGQEIQAFRRAIELNPDLVSVYENLGAALYSAGEKQSAIQVFRQGLQINPLSALLYYDLSLALDQQGDASGAKRAMTLATKLDPDIAAHQQK